MYSLLIDTYISDKHESDYLFNAIENSKDQQQLIIINNYNY